jgi:hypothetical protein
LLAVVQDKDALTTGNQAPLTTDIKHGFLAHEESRFMKCTNRKSICYGVVATVAECAGGLGMV